MKKKIPHWAGVVVLVAMGFLATNVHADLIISNLNGNDGSQSADIDDLRSKAMGFTMPGGTDYTLDYATLRLETFGPDITVFVELWSNTGGQLGVLLESLTSPGFNAQGISNYDFASSGTTLEAGESYWLLAYGTAGGDRVDWKASSPAQAPTGLATHLGALFDTDGPPPVNNSGILNSYSINGTPANIPEPASAVLLCLMGVGLAVRRRR